MKVEKIINNTGEDYSPYMGELVNHLPMAQWAVYKLSGESKAVEQFTNKYLETKSINRVKKEYKDVNSLEEALANRDLYEGTLQFLKEKVKTQDKEDLTKDILNKYPLGMSSGLFHTLIRVAYGLEAYKEIPELKEELLRGLAYYITAYREARIFKREIHSSSIREEMEALAKDVHTREILENKDTLGMSIRALYSDEKYMEKGFIIKGEQDTKIRTLLELLIPLFYEKGNIVILHCITSIHALIVLKDYYDDFENAVDILTTCIITHVLSTRTLLYPKMRESTTGFSWRCIIEKSLKSSDAHDKKLTYSAFCLDKLYGIEQLKDISIKRIRHL